MPHSWGLLSIRISGGPRRSKTCAPLGATDSAPQSPWISRCSCRSRPRATESQSSLMSSPPRLIAPAPPKNCEHPTAWWPHAMRIRLDYRLALALIFGLALFVRVVPLTYSHFWDETVFLQDAKVIVDGRTNYDEFFERPPLLSIVYALGFALWDNIYVANLIQGLWTTTAVLFAFGSYFVETSHELLTDMPAVALMLAAMWLFDKSGAPFALLAGVAYALSIETRFTALFLMLY